MHKTLKLRSVIAAVVVVFAVVAFAGVMAGCDMDLSRFAGTEYVTKTYEVQEEFYSISIDVDTSKIEFVPAGEENGKVVCMETQKVTHCVSVQDSTLRIEIVDTRKWYEQISILFESPKMTVYLPQSEYVSLRIDTDTGDIVIPKDFSFGTMRVEGDTADVECYASVLDTVKIESDTGNIRLDTAAAGQVDLATDTGDVVVSSVAVTNGMTIETDTGNIKLTDITCTDITAQSDTGDIQFKNVLATASLSAQNDTGNVKFDDSDAAEITVRTSTGNVTGTLRSEKVFLTETSTGRIRVPETTSGGKCEIKTSTGNIDISIKP